VVIVGGPPGSPPFTRRPAGSVKCVEDRPTDRQDEPVRIVEYDPAWPGRFASEATLIDAAIGPFITGGIHHVGSSAVQGLAAKPIIDILVGVADLASARGCIHLLAQVDYVYAPYLPEVMLWFCKPDPSRRTHHLHLVPTGSQRFADELAFRDYLRSHPDRAAEYEALKRQLASQHEHDREAYTEGKSAFIADTLTRSQQR
jgi:GrpB-like predicted nucleotidyltransferase (UPF0157 family)